MCCHWSLAVDLHRVNRMSKTSNKLLKLCQLILESSFVFFYLNVIIVLPIRFSDAKCATARSASLGL